MMELVVAVMLFGGCVLSFYLGQREVRRHAEFEASLNKEYTFVDYVRRHREWSFNTFGPAVHTDSERLCRHIEKELNEIRLAPWDCEEWIDVMVLAIDGATRAGYSPETIARTLERKQEKNKNRVWNLPVDPMTPIEHHRIEERETNL